MNFRADWDLRDWQPSTTSLPVNLLWAGKEGKGGGGGVTVQFV